jgi:hypothetical protein
MSTSAFLPEILTMQASDHIIKITDPLQTQENKEKICFWQQTFTRNARVPGQGKHAKDKGMAWQKPAGHECGNLPVLP